MDDFSANYIKPRTSNLTNMTASIITNKRKSQTIFTGYERQIEAINQGFKTQRGGVVFNGAEGPALINLKNGEIWTPPETLNAILTTNYCSEPGSCNTLPPIPSYTIQCDDSLGIQYVSIGSIAPFYINYNTSIPNTGVVKFFFYTSASNLDNPVGSQILPLNSPSLLVTPVGGTGYNMIGYVFRCTPLLIIYPDETSGALELGYPYSFKNNTGSSINLTLTLQDNSTMIIPISSGFTYTPNPSYIFKSYIFSSPL